MKRSELIQLVTDFLHYSLKSKDYKTNQLEAEILVRLIEKTKMSLKRSETPKMMILVGNIGFGKSTWASKQIGYEIVNQDVIGNRNNCIKRTKQYLQEGKSVIIDRTNIDKKQRAYWIEIAKEFNVEIHCVEFKTDTKLARERVINRKDHPTITPDFPLEKIDEIIDTFNEYYQTPEISEGFTSITYITDSSTIFHK
jgi:stress-induced morphogen